MTIKNNVRLIFFAILLVFIVSFFCNLYFLNRKTEEMKLSNITYKMVENILQARRYEKNFILRGEEKYVAYFKLSLSELFSGINEYNKNVNRHRRTNDIKELAAVLKRYEELGINYIKQYKDASQRMESVALIREGRKAVNLCKKIQEETFFSIIRYKNNIIKVQAILLIFSIFVGLLVFLIISRAVINPVRKLQNICGEISREKILNLKHVDLLDDLLKSVNSKNEIGGLIKGYKKMVMSCNTYYLDLKEYMERFRALAESSFEGIVIYDNDKIIEANQAFVSMFEYELSEIIGRTGIEFIMDPESQDSLREKMYSENQECYEARCVKKDGSVFPVEICIRKIPYKGSNVRVMAIRDINRIKKVEAALVESEEKYRSLVENLDIGIYRNTIDFQGVFLHANPAMARIFGYDSVQEFMEVRFSDLYQSPEEGKRFVEEISAKSFVNDRELCLRKKDGIPIWCSCTARVQYDKEGKIEWVNGVMEDITERKQIEYALEKRTHERELLYRLKSKFTSVVSHELRTPLTAIKEGIALILDGSAGSINEEQSEFLGIAEKNVDRLARLINDVLDFSKLTANKEASKKDNVIINEVIESVANMYKLAAEKKGLSIFRELESTKGMKIMIDSDRFSQVLMNFVNNAIKFTDNGKIIIATFREADLNSVKICVEDTGQGIKPLNLPRLFEPFFQIEGRNRRKTGSTGLGLAICKEIIEQSGGRVWVESEFGKGSKFYFILPVEERRKI